MWGISYDHFQAQNPSFPKIVKQQFFSYEQFAFYTDMNINTFLLSDYHILFLVLSILFTRVRIKNSVYEKNVMNASLIGLTIKNIKRDNIRMLC